MKVTYKHSSGDTVICHGLGHLGELGYYIGPLGDTDDTDTEWSVEPMKYIGADNAVPRDAGNGVHVFDLWVFREFATDDEARSFARNLAGQIPRGGASLEVTEEIVGYKTTYATAVLQKLSVKRNCSLCNVLFLFQTSVPVLEAVAP